MAICKDCLHVGVCPNLNHKTVADGCPDFKNRELFVELPCELYTTVYCLDWERCRKKAWHACDCYCYGWDVSCRSYVGNKSVVEKAFIYSMIPSIGRTVFLTREEAEAALAKMKEG